MPVYKLEENTIDFPHPSLSEDDGLLAFGGDLSVPRLIEAYKNGIFPWYGHGQPVLWWSLDPRLVLFPKEFKPSKSLCRLVRKQKFKVTVDTAFSDVIRACANVPRSDQEGTWILPEMIKAYESLHYHGYAHSFETWYDGKLAGGLYGVSIGKAFFGESMFHFMNDASKVAFYHFVMHLENAGFYFVDAQMSTKHLLSLGAREISREKYLVLLKKAIQEDEGKVWNKGSV
ncbi:MAG: leucyl/phenylalanyl-tRNA--protein transferase [Bacteroidales bacterium]|nr:leucyl/phenylalanyl-tRNA--protein transferase [Bacteroidales bacterium]